jgi:fucose permease
VPAVLVAASGLALIGFASLLVPSLVPAIETRFGQADAAVGVALFITASAYVVGSFAGGPATERVGRRPVLSVAAVLVAAGLAGQAIAGTWPMFVAAGAVAGLGSGAIDGGMNALVLEAYGGRASGRLNAAHLGFGAGALAAPFVVGQLVPRGIDWQALFAATALLALAFAPAVARAAMPSGRHVREPNVATARSGGLVLSTSLPLLTLALAIATYVSAEIGVSTWLVRFLAAAPLAVATGALGVYWGGLTLGRLVAAIAAERIPSAPFAVAAVLGASLALVGAVAVSDVAQSVVLFGLVGFASGPVYPLIMAIAGERYPRRSALIAGSLAGVAVVGGVVYPPLMGLLSESVGIRGGMLGAAVLGVVCALAVVMATRAGDGAASRTLAAT